MLTRLRLQNFKAWKDTGQIRLAPLTVLFGTNSAGKTSIPQLLLLLKQTAESSDRQRALQFGDDRTAVDLGTFGDVVHAHNLESQLKFELSWTLGKALTITDPVSRKSFRGDSLSFEATIEADSRQQPFVRCFEYALEQGDRAIPDKGYRLTLDARLDKHKDDGKYDLESQRYQLRRHQGRAWPLPGPVRFYGFPSEANAYHQNAEFTSDLALEMERLLSSIYYVGPLREYPRRLYAWSGETPDHVGAKGDRSVEAILAGAQRSFNYKAKRKKMPLAELVAERLHRMGLISEFHVRPLVEHRKEYEVLVRTSSRLPEVRLTDVGFGVSQVLPVIVECFFVPARSIVIFEQPEIHLHPRVQADLADLFVDAVNAREDGVPRECQFIVESHSEHFLRRLQRRIAERALSTDETALYFVRAQGESARIEELEVDKYGNISNWPPGFFGDEMADLVARADAQARRMDAGNAG